MRVEHGQVLDRAFNNKATCDKVVARFTAAARAGIAKGAETVIPAGGIALTKMAEMTVRSRAPTGVFTSRRMMYAPPTGTLLADIRAPYGDHVYPGAT